MWSFLGLLPQLPPNMAPGKEYDPLLSLLAFPTYSSQGPAQVL